MAGLSAHRLAFFEQKAWTWALCVLLFSAKSSGAEGYIDLRFDRVENGAFAPVPGAPQVLVQLPSSPSPGPVHLVLHFHGHSGCIEVIARAGPTPCADKGSPRQGWNLFGAHAASRTRSWLILPQLAFLERNGSPGRLGEPGRARRLIEEVIQGVVQRGYWPHPVEVASLTITAHSGGFEAARAVIRHGGVEHWLKHLVLFDALYAGVDDFGRWAAASRDRSLIIITGRSGTPAALSQVFVSRYQSVLGDRLVPPESASLEKIAQGQVVLLRTTTSHRNIPIQFLGPVLERLLGPQTYPRKP